MQQLRGEQSSEELSQLRQEASGDEDKLQLLTWLGLDVACDSFPQIK
jgi:hypothetical protein